MALPVIKIGAVILGDIEDTPHFLVCQPKGKGNRPGLPPLGFVRGTRQYQDLNTGLWHDAPRDGLSSLQDAMWESPLATLLREVEEEAGLSRSLLQNQTLYQLGERPFLSQNVAPYPVAWFVIMLNKPIQQPIPHTSEQGLQDSLYTAWYDIESLLRLSQQTDPTKPRLSPGYIAVAEEVLARRNGQGFGSVLRLPD